MRMPLILSPFYIGHKIAVIASLVQIRQFGVLVRHYKLEQFGVSLLPTAVACKPPGEVTVMTVRISGPFHVFDRRCLQESRAKLMILKLFVMTQSSWCD